MRLYLYVGELDNIFTRHTVYRMPSGISTVGKFSDGELREATVSEILDLHRQGEIVLAEDATVGGKTYAVDTMSSLLDWLYEGQFK